MNTHKLKIPLLLACSAILFIAARLNLEDKPKGLKDYYKKYFAIGVAVRPSDLKNHEESSLILNEFNSITPENAMKMGPIHPSENRYFWRDADEIVDFAVRNKIKARGHALCWHAQTHVVEATVGTLWSTFAGKHTGRVFAFAFERIYTGSIWKFARYIFMQAPLQ